MQRCIFRFKQSRSSGNPPPHQLAGWFFWGLLSIALPFGFPPALPPAVAQAETGKVESVTTETAQPETAQPETDKPDESVVPEGINVPFLNPELDAQEWINRFEVESREIFACRKAIVASLKLRAGTRIADVGAGTGLFLPLFSRAVAEEGKVFAMDISPRLIAHLKQRVAGKGLKNVDVVLSKENSTDLPSGSIDLVFICDTYHHFEYYDEMLRSINQGLREGGELVVIDFERIEGVTREWLLSHVRAGKERVRKEITKAGFQFLEEVDIEGLQENYFLRFQKPSQP